MKHFTYIILLILISLFLIPSAFAEPKVLQQGMSYNTNILVPSEFNVDSIIQEAKEEGFWVRLGLEPNSSYYKGTNISSECSFFKENEFF